MVASSVLFAVALPASGGVDPPARGVVRIAVLDVGQGDATLVRSGGAAVLVDTGPPGADVERRVRDVGSDRIDGIVLTHDSLDHRGGFEAALAGLRPGWVAMPRFAPGPWERVRTASPVLHEWCAGHSVDVGRARIDVLHPPCSGVVTPRTDDLHNDGAMVLLVSHGDVRVLLPADAEAPVLLGLGLPRLDALRVSHHGSEDPALAELLGRTSPQVAVISAGRGNSYGHPRRQVIETLQAHAVRTFRTDRDGSVVLDSDGRVVVRAR
jgi:competence protein ComEC